MASITIRDFSAGQNNEYDPRALQPNSSEDTSAEAQLIKNFDFAGQGALITSPGFETFISLGTGQKVLYLGEFNADESNRYLIAVSNNNVYGISYWQSAVIHDCDLATGGSYGNFTLAGTDDAINLSTQTTATSIKQGIGAVQFDIDVSNSANNYAIVEGASITSVDLSAYTSDGYIRFWVYLPSITDFTSIELRVGSSSTDYYTWTLTAGIDPVSGASKALAAGWNYLSGALSGATTSGTPNAAAIDYVLFKFNYAVAFLDQTGVRIDDLRAIRASTTPVVKNLGGWTNTVTKANGTVFNGSQAIKWMILGADGNNQPRRVRQTSLGVLDLLSGINPGVNGTYIVESMMGFCFFAKDRTAYYCASEDETSFGVGAGSISFDSRIIGMKKTLNKSLIALLEDNESQQVTFSFDDTTYEYTPIKDPYMAGIGGISHKTAQQVYSDTLFLNKDGVAYFGQNPELVDSNFRVTSLSWKVDPEIKRMNYLQQEISAAYYFGRDYGVSVPVGDAVDYNTDTYVYSYKYNSWRYRTGFYPSCFASYRKDYQSELYFGSASSDVIYKFNSDYSYDGSGYVRHYITKIFNMGSSLIMKRVPYIEIAGSMPRGTDFYVLARVDGNTVAFKVDDTAIVTTSSGFIGDDFIGDTFYGGSETDELYAFYRFYQRINLPSSIVEGNEFQFEFYQDTEGQPLKIDFFNIVYEKLSEKKLPVKHHNNLIVPSPI